MSTSHGTGTWWIRRTRAAFSSRWARQTPPTLHDRIRAYAPLPPPLLKSRCAVRGSFFSSVAEHGDETGPPRQSYAERAEAEHMAMLRAVTRFFVADNSPHGLILWGDWKWADLPSPSSQMWPTSRARRGEWGWTE